MRWIKFETSQLVNFNNEGDFITGEFISKEPAKGKYGSTYYTFKDLKTKEIKGFFGSAVIDRLFTTAENQGKLKEGIVFKLVYKGKVKSKNGRLVKNFEIYFTE